MIPAMRDTRGRESKTLTFVAISWAALVAKFLAAGVDLGALGKQPPMSGTEFGSAVSVVLLIWLGREWTEKRKPEAPANGGKND